MATLKEIRNKLRSISNIQKITQAMEMVAASRLKRSQIKTEKGRPFLRKLKEIIENLLQSSSELTHPLIQQKSKDKKIGFVIVAGDRGLCGSYNNNIFTVASKFLEKIPQDKVELIIIGQKAVNHFNGKNWKIRDKVVDWSKLSFEQIKELVNKLINYYLSEEFSEIWIVYTHFQNIMTHRVVVEKFLNIEIPQKSESKLLSFIIEPTEQEVFTEVLPRYCISKFQLILNESFTSELSARIMAMRAATKNAEEMFDKLTLERNKLRQSGITKELIEITSGIHFQD